MKRIEQRTIQISASTNFGGSGDIRTHTFEETIRCLKNQRQADIDCNYQAKNTPKIMSISVQPRAFVKQ